MPEATTRDFKITDDKMIQDSRLKHATFLEDKTDFIAFVPDFGDPFAANFDADIDAAEATDDDETVTDQQMQLTNKVLEEMQKSRDKYQDSKSFVVKAFPDDFAIQNEFGFNDYRQAQKGQDSMTKFMTKFHLIATKYKTQLIAKNYTQAKIDEIKTRHDALKDADIAQELFIKNRPVKTADRINKLNKAWNGETTICTAGKRIYKDNYGKYQRYLLPPGEEAPEILSVVGKITNSASNAVEEGVEISIAALSITVLSDSEGNYGIGGLPAGTYTLVFTKATLQSKTVNNVVVTDGAAKTLDVVMDPV